MGKIRGELMYETLMKTENLERKFEMPDKTTFCALNNINITIPKGKLTILRGKSGSGKTTLMNLLGALDKPTAGEIYLNDLNSPHFLRKKLLRLEETR